MRLRALGLIVLSVIILVSMTLLSYGDKSLGKVPDKSAIPGSNGVTGETFGQFTNTVKIAEWDRENTFINYNLFLKQGVGPEITSLDERNDNLNPNGIKVLLIGDSFVWGDGVTDAGMTVGTRLQDELNSLTKPGAFNVISYGKAGASTYNHAEYYTKEKISTINPDVIVYGYYVNDTVPNFNEKMICLDKSLCNQFSPQTAPEYRNCISGDSNKFNKIVKNSVRKLYPSLANELIVRNCDSIFQKLSKSKHTDEELWSDNSINPWFPTWKKAVSIFASNTKGVPTYMAQLYLNKPVLPNVKEIEKEFIANSIPVIPMPSALDKIYEVGSGPLSLNPVNGHSNSTLTKLYAKDIAQYLLANLQPSLIAKSQAQIFASKRNLVASILPVSVKLTQNTSSTSLLAVDDFKESDSFPHLIAGKPLPNQYVACTDLGYPHIQVNLNRFLTPGQRVIFSPNSKDNLNLTLGYYFYDKDYVSKYVEVGPLRSNTQITVPNDSHGMLVTIGIKTKSKCPLDEVVTLPNFSIGMILA